jgi:hypothetical protein
MFACSCSRCGVTRSEAEEACCVAAVAQLVSTSPVESSEAIML